MNSTVMLVTFVPGTLICSSDYSWLPAGGHCKALEPQAVWFTCSAMCSEKERGKAQVI